MFSYLSDAIVLVFLFMSSIFVLALMLKNNSIVDIFWGLGFILLTLYSLINSEKIETNKVVVSLMVILWGLRLSIHIFLRNRRQPEDFRYANWRKIWKYFVLRSFFQIYMLQGFFMLIICWPVIHTNSAETGGFGFIEIMGILIFVAGFLFESIGDYQLSEFRKNVDNKGKLMTSGLWKYTRHPNYFGEALLWWGIWLMAVPVIDGIYTILSPITITLLVRYISGVPMLEKKYKSHPDWEAYKTKTPVFVPFLK